jgi:hypothetical protein
MRRTVLTLCAVALLAPAASTPAVAKTKPKPPPKPVCNLIVDDPGGTGGSYKGSPALDVTGADLASGKKTVKVVVRVATTNMDNDTWAAVGYEWFMSWRMNGTEFAVDLRRTFDSDELGWTYKARFRVGTTYTDWPADWKKVTIDPKSYTWVLPRTAIPFLKKPKQVFYDLQAGSQSFGGNVDQASTLTKYVDQTPSCLKPE